MRNRRMPAAIWFACDAQCNIIIAMSHMFNNIWPNKWTTDMEYSSFICRIHENTGRQWPQTSYNHTVLMREGICVYISLCTGVRLFSTRMDFGTSVYSLPYIRHHMILSVAKTILELSDGTIQFPHTTNNKQPKYGRFNSSRLLAWHS